MQLDLLATILPVVQMKSTIPYYNSAKIDYIKLNGEYLSEFLLHGYLAAYLGIPIIF